MKTDWRYIEVFTIFSFPGGDPTLNCKKQTKSFPKKQIFAKTEEVVKKCKIWTQTSDIWKKQARDEFPTPKHLCHLLCWISKSELSWISQSDLSEDELLFPKCVLISPPPLLPLRRRCTGKDTVASQVCQKCFRFDRWTQIQKYMFWSASKIFNQIWERMYRKDTWVALIFMRFCSVPWTLWVTHSMFLTWVTWITCDMRWKFSPPHVTAAHLSVWQAKYIYKYICSIC